MPPKMNRRAFLGTSAGAFAVAVAMTPPLTAREDPRPLPTGPVYGKIGSKGIRPGTALSPSRGDATILDGRTVDVAHVTGRGIAPGKGVLLCPEEDGSFSVLYAEV